MRLSKKPTIDGQSGSITKKRDYILRSTSHLTVPENIIINVQIPWIIKEEGEGSEEKLL